MKVLLLGGGGREHALAWKLLQSPKLGRLYAMPGCWALKGMTELVEGDPADPQAVLNACRGNAIDLVVVGPEAPLAAGVADTVRAAGFKVFGPGREAARLESSKSFAKAFMKRHGIPTAEHETYDDASTARDAAAELELPLVVKADGLAAGKGVRVCRTRQEAVEAVQDFMLKEALGAAAKTVVIERFLEGREATLMVLCDGKTFIPLSASQDHKRVGDGDSGPNTGGMGAIAPVPWLSPEDMSLAHEEILFPTLKGLKADGIDFRGTLYFGLMFTADGPRLLEYNVRFGDPETQAVLPLLKNDLLAGLAAAAAGDLGAWEPVWRPGYSVCVVLASEGYPGTPKTGRRITGLESVADIDPTISVFHSGTHRAAEDWMTAGGRVLGVTAVSKTVQSARDKAYEAVSKLHFNGVHYRKDIGGATALSERIK